MSGFAVTNVVPRIQAIATLGDTQFYFTFQLYAATDLVVFDTPFGNQPNDLSQLLTYNIGYTVTLNAPTTPGGPFNGGYITLTTPAGGADIITIVRLSPMQRQNYYINGGLFDQVMVNNDFNSDVLFDQQNSMYNTQVTPHYNLSASPVYPRDIVLPQLPANCVWQMNAGGTAIVAVPISGGSSGGNVTAILPTVTNAITKFANTGGTIVDSALTENTPGALGGVVSIDGVPWPPDDALWVTASTDTVMVAGTNYICVSPGGTLNMTLPTTVALGTTITVVGFTATGFVIVQSAGQQVLFGNQSTTSGAGGSISSTNARDNIKLLCVVANTTFVVLSGVGNLTIV